MSFLPRKKRLMCDKMKIPPEIKSHAHFTYWSIFCENTENVWSNFTWMQSYCLSAQQIVSANILFTNVLQNQSCHYKVN